MIMSHAFSSWFAQRATLDVLSPYGVDLRLVQVSIQHGVRGLRVAVGQVHRRYEMRAAAQ
jgi:hypothetical protein